MQEPSSENNGRGEGPVLFEATLYPHRSLSPRGFGLLMACVAGFSFAAGLLFTSLGAWPVMGFFGLDVALFYFAFRYNYRAGKLAETIRLTRDDLVVRRIHPNGRVQEWRMQPYWLRVDWTPQTEELGAPPAEVRLSSHGRSVGIGRFLTDDERASFSAALQTALARCRSLPELA